MGVFEVQVLFRSGETSVVLRFDEATREIMKLEKGTVR